MNTWIWLHPLRGGAYLVNMSNVCYFVGNDDDHTTKLVFANGEEMIVTESENYVINGLKHEL
jgi:hypothetical protein